jgi:hypothetical protein
MAGEETTAPGFAEDVPEKQDSLASQKCRQEGSSTESGADRSADTSNDREVEFEDTINSTTSKEFSFGTTQPPQLPVAEELNAALIAHESPQDGSLAVLDEETGTQQTSRSERSGSLPVAEASPPEKEASPVERKGSTPSQLHVPAEKTSNGDLLASSPKSSNSSEAGELFTFGNTNPLQLPDPALLRQASFASDGPRQVAELFAAAKNSPDFPLPTNRQVAIPEVPSPPMTDASPMPPTLPPNEGVAFRSHYSRSPSQMPFNGEVACYASPPALMQLQVSPPMMQYCPQPVMQPYLQPQVCLGADGHYHQDASQVADFHEGQSKQHPAIPDFEDFSAVPHYNADLESYMESSYQTDCFDARRFSTASMQVQGMWTPDEAIPDEDEHQHLRELSLEKLNSVFSNYSHRRIAASCFIIGVLIVAACGIVVLLVMK